MNISNLLYIKVQVADSLLLLYFTFKKQIMTDEQFRLIKDYLRGVDSMMKDLPDSFDRSIEKVERKLDKLIDLMSELIKDKS